MMSHIGIMIMNNNIHMTNSSKRKHAANLMGFVMLNHTRNNYQNQSAVIIIGG